MPAVLANEPVAISVSEPRHLPASVVALPCNRCGAKERTANFYLTNRADNRYIKGFYSDDSIRLCAGCLRAALDALNT